MTERSRRRFARRQWARRWLNWKPVLVLLLVGALVAGAGWLLYFSSLLAVQGVQVTGVEQLSEAEVRRAAAVPPGQALIRVDLDRVSTRVEALAPVRSVDVTRQWPDEIRIAVTERTAIAAVDLGGSLHGMDETGVIFVDYRRAPDDLPRVVTPAGTGEETLREGARVVAALPADLAAEVNHVDLESIDQITLVLRDGRDVLWGSAEESEEKARVLAVLLAQPGRHFDVSVPGQPTARP